jgi:hypothetical protein
VLEALGEGTEGRLILGLKFAVMVWMGGPQIFFY